MANELVIQPTQKVGKDVCSTTFKDYWIVKSAFFLNTKAALIFEDHCPEELGMGDQPGCIDLETLALNL